MPWTIGDVDRHKKGLTPAQKKKWVKIANGVLKDCQAKGGKGCDAKAIRIANSKFTKEGLVMKEGTKVPKGALRFVEQGCHAHVEFAEDGDKTTPKLKMVGYSGGIIKGHFFWGDLAIDLKGMKFKQSKFPVLENHMTSKKVAVIGKPIIENGKLEAPDNAKFLSTPESEEFQRLSGEGFPYQSSIYAKPLSVERLEEGTSAEVNGFKMKGPGTIWRVSEFKEMSVCVFGWDTNTRASAFSREEKEVIDYLEDKLDNEVTLTQEQSKPGKEVKKEMTKNELLADHSELVQEIVDEAMAKAEAAFDKEKADFETKLATEKEEKSELSDRILKLEKDNLLRREEGFKVKANSIWTQKLADSKIPVHLHGKVNGFVTYTKFVTDDVFDTSKFSEAVDAEIKDWEDKGVVDTVIGAGFSEKEVGDNAQEQENRLADENKALVDRLVAKSGIKVPKGE